MKSDIIKIIVVTNSLARGGTEKHLLGILTQLIGSQFDIVIYCLHEKGELSAEFEAAGIRVHSPLLLLGLPGRLKNNRLLKYLVSICSFIILVAQLRPAIIHFFLPAGYLVLGPVSVFFWRIKKVMSRRSLNAYQLKYSKWVRWLEIWLHKRMTRVVANSQDVFNELLNDEAVPLSRLKLLYNGVARTTAPGKKSSKFRSQYCTSSQTKLLVIVANLFPYKGHADLLNACGQIKRKDWVLLIVGRDSTNLKCDLLDLAKQLTIADQIFFLGERKDIDTILYACDIGLLVSHEEGFSNAVLECMASALPMIATNAGGNREAVIDGKTGFMVPAKNPAQICKAIEILMDDEPLRTKMGIEGKFRVASEFSMERCLEGYRDLYSSIISNR